MTSIRVCGYRIIYLYDVLSNTLSSKRHCYILILYFINNELSRLIHDYYNNI